MNMKNEKIEAGNHVIKNPETWIANDFDNWGANNATKSTYCSIGNQTVVTTTTYTYNANGYPVSATQSNTNNSGTFTTSYSYTCH